MAIYSEPDEGTTVKLYLPRLVAQIDDAALDQLGSALKGDLVQKGDAAYDEARTIWNAMIDRYPALIARCANADDVAKSVTFAKDNSLLLAVRGPTAVRGE